jgi:hypothetical protein
LAIIRAKLVRFYKFSHDEIVSMPYKNAMEYYKAIEILESQELLKDLKAHDWAHRLKDDDRRKMHRGLVKKAWPNMKRKTVTMDVLDKFLGG